MGGKLQSRADSVLLSIDEELKALTQSQSQSQSQVELTLDTSAVEHAVKHMSFMQMKRKHANPTVIRHLFLSVPKRGERGLLWFS